MIASTAPDTFYMKLSATGTPTRFRWRGRLYRVDAIERIWRSPQARLRKQRYYRIRSGNRRFMLRHDCLSDHWSMVRAPWRARLSLALSGLATRIVV